ncbi:MAG: class II fumarate hydratase [Sterolibacterium sp.]|jgi:fumarate hydratase class II
MSTETRIEHDTFGAIAVPADMLWGAQTQRSLIHFRISTERMPESLLMALARIKRIGASVNAELGLLDAALAGAIGTAADEVLAGRHPGAFPLAVWQTGSGTQTNMNMNEVLANRASELLGGGRGELRRVHPNDHVNLGQSSNDVFPSAMHVAAVCDLTRNLLPALRALRASLSAKAAAFGDIVKIGRTHLQDATPVTLGQEISGWVAQLEHAERAINAGLDALNELAVGGTAVGTGLNTHPQFGERVAARLADETGQGFRCAANRFAALASHDPLVSSHGNLKTLAVALMKIANDIRWLASGPRCGLGELHLPENEPGSSIMPGKVNPTQCEAVTMVCCQVIGNDVAISIGGASGNFELNVFKPMIAHNFLQSVRLLGDAMASFDEYCVRGLEPDRQRIAEQLTHSLMLVTALTPHIGYDRAATIAKQAQDYGVTLREAAVMLGEVTEAQFDAWVRPERMV